MGNCALNSGCSCVHNKKDCEEPEEPARPDTYQRNMQANRRPAGARGQRFSRPLREKKAQIRRVVRPDMTDLEADDLHWSPIHLRARGELLKSAFENLRRRTRDGPKLQTLDILNEITVKIKEDHIILNPEVYSPAPSSDPEQEAYREESEEVPDQCEWLSVPGIPGSIRIQPAHGREEEHGYAHGREAHSPIFQRPQQTQTPQDVRRPLLENDDTSAVTCPSECSTSSPGSSHAVSPPVLWSKSSTSSRAAVARPETAEHLHQRGFLDKRCEETERRGLLCSPDSEELVM